MEVGEIVTDIWEAEWTRGLETQSAQGGTERTEHEQRDGGTQRRRERESRRAGRPGTFSSPKVTTVSTPGGSTSPQACSPSSSPTPRRRLRDATASQTIRYSVRSGRGSEKSIAPSSGVPGGPATSRTQQ